MKDIEQEPAIDNQDLTIAYMSGFHDGKKKRQFVGLTEDERTNIRSRVQEYTPIDSVKYGLAIQYATEEAIKEKNQ